MNWKTLMRWRLLPGLILCGAMGCAAAQSFPTREVTLIAPFAAGGTSDVVARTVAKAMGQELGKPIVVINKVGAGGRIGVAAGAAAAPDGYTMVLGGLGSVVFASGVAKEKLSFDPRKDLIPIGPVGEAPTVIVARADLPANNLEQLVALAKKAPGTVKYGSAGVGGTLHMAAVLLEKAAHIDLLHVPYRGGAPAMTELLGGQIDLVFADLTLVQPFLNSGKIKTIALASRQRSSVVPNLPTTAEQGFATVRMDTWYALFVPRATPDSQLNILRGALAKARVTPEFTKLLSAQAISPSTATETAFATALQGDFDSWLPLLKQVCAANSCE